MRLPAQAYGNRSRRLGRRGGRPATSLSLFRLPADPLHMDERPGARHLADRHLDQTGLARAQRFLERRAQLLRAAHPRRGDAEAFGEPREIGICEVARDHAVAMLLLLDAPHIAIGVVVEDDEGHWDAMARRA